MNQRNLTLGILAVLSLALNLASAAEPDGYYDSCKDKCGQALLTALYNKISSHTEVSYKGLWTAYETTDVDSDGKIWDMYSTKRWTPVDEQCGNYSNVGDCYNREHSFPKSWFKDDTPMYTDLFHLYPTDGKVNSHRSNYPFGECENGTYTASYDGVDACGKLGASTFEGYTGTVFEPVDEYKGDFARTYFYMAACYNDKIAGWSSDMLAGNAFPAFSTWAVNLLLKWHRLDPVSQKEIDRCEAVYGIQGNRNPFIDHPELVEHIWGNKSSVNWTGSAAADPEITVPVYNSTIALGAASVGIQRSFTVQVRAVNLSAPITASISGTGFSLPSTTITAADAMSAAGASLTVNCTPVSTGTLCATLSLASTGATTDIVNLTVEAYTGLPALEPAAVSDDRFTARWVNIDAASATYQLHVKQGASYVSGYPMSLSASLEQYEVTGLDASTAYTYYLTSSTLTSNVVNVATLDPQPVVSISPLSWEFTTETGTRSTVKEFSLDTENLTEDVTVAVISPFRVCKDYSVSTQTGSWSSSVSMGSEESTFYVCVDGTQAADGTYACTLTASANGTSAEADLSATIGNPTETFENAGWTGTNYATADYQGVAYLWKVTNGRILADSSKSHEGTNAAIIRYNNSTDSSIEMAQDKTGGAGTLSFYLANWSASEGNSTVKVAYSVDQGANWVEIATYDLTNNDSAYALKSIAINQPGGVRVKFTVTASSGTHRVKIDDITITDCYPIVSLTPDTPLSFTASQGSCSPAVAVAVATVGVKSQVTITVPSPFQVATSASGAWATSATVSPGGAIIYVRLNAEEASLGSYGGNIAVSSTEYSSASAAAISGTVVDDPVVPTTLTLSHEDGPICLTCVQGSTSSIAGIAFDTNYENTITVYVKSPFQVGAVYNKSTTSCEWDELINVNPASGMFYVHLDGTTDVVGNYAATVTATAGAKVATIAVTGTIYDAAAAQTCVETFEDNSSNKYYNNKTDKEAYEVDGSQYTWEFFDAGIWSSDPAYGGNNCVRFGTTTGSYMAMKEDKTNGVGTVSFYAKRWYNSQNSTFDESSTVLVQYSTDRGTTWLPSLVQPSQRRAASLTDVTNTVNNEEYEAFESTINQTGDVRVRLLQTDGKRINIDNVALTSYFPSTEVETLQATEELWSAYCRNHSLVIDCAAYGLAAEVYGVDGICRFARTLPTGMTHVTLEPGLYIVVVGDTARRVLVK